jgi:acetoin:2,6-dichlorophenolindophenol oxidoreductase subunit beta
LFAQGVSDPSSMWGTLKGIGNKFTENRVIEMPIAENGAVGIAVGAAIAGQRPIISFHRVEFALLAFEQIVNNAAKSSYISNGQHKVPLVIRMVIGRGWGQGPEHSQSLEPLFAYFPGLKVVMPAFAADAKGMLIAAIEDDNPVIFIEHRFLHNSTGHVPDGYYKNALDGPRVVREGKDVTIVATSHGVLEAMRAADVLHKIGCSAEVIDMRVLRPLNVEPIVGSVRKTGRLVTVDTGFVRFGIGAEILASVMTEAFNALKAAPVRLGLPDHPTPSSRGLIPGFYPDSQRIVREVGKMLSLDQAKVDSALKELDIQRKDLQIDQPDPFFKGPF